MTTDLQLADQLDTLTAGRSAPELLVVAGSAAVEEVADRGPSRRHGSTSTSRTQGSAADGPTARVYRLP